MEFHLGGDPSDCKNLQQLKQFIKCEYKHELEVFSHEELAVDMCFGLWPCVLFCSRFQTQASIPSDPAEAGLWSIVHFYSTDIYFWAVRQQEIVLTESGKQVGH